MMTPAKGALLEVVGGWTRGARCEESNAGSDVVDVVLDVFVDMVSMGSNQIWEGSGGLWTGLTHHIR